MQRNKILGELDATKSKPLDDDKLEVYHERQAAENVDVVDSSAVRKVSAKKPLKRLREVGGQSGLINEARSLRSKKQKVEVQHSTASASFSVKKDALNLKGRRNGDVHQTHLKDEMLDPGSRQAQVTSSVPPENLATEVVDSMEDSDASSGEDSDSEDDDSMYSSESSCMKDRLRSKSRLVALRASQRIRDGRKPDGEKARAVSPKKTRQMTGLSGELCQKSSGDSGVVDFSASDSDSGGQEPRLKYEVKGTRVKRRKSAPASTTVDTSPPETDELCAICQFAGAAELMLLCDKEGCEYACHTFCLKPPLHAVPEEEWVCPYCSGPSRKRTAKTTFASKEIEKLLGRRLNASKTSAEDSDAKFEYLVKWRSYSHHHDTWVPEEWLSFVDRTRLLAFQRKHPLKEEDEDAPIDDRRAEWFGVDRVIAYRIRGSNSYGVPQLPSLPRSLSKSDGDVERYEYLVKWKGLEYDAATWETCTTGDVRAGISTFDERHQKAEARYMQSQNLVFTNLKVQPDYVNGGVLHNYQLSGLKWLLCNFLERKSVILADEMGLGKTIQAAAFMVCARREFLTPKPFLVIAPKSTLSGWEQELHTWASSLNCLVYQGEKEARSVIQKYEFYTAGKKPLFDVLVTSYELAMIDSSILQKFEWSTIIVDEGHRVKNFQCKLSILLKRVHSDFRVLLTGTPVQNTLAELFALLHFLDPTEFPDPDDAACEFGHVDAIGTNSLRDEMSIKEQVARIHELLRPRMLRRLKTEVLRDLIPGKKLVEVPCALTPYQRRLYITILKKNYKELNKGVKNGQKRSLNSILMDLKMCCNHPYLFPEKEPKSLSKEEEHRLLVEASGKFQLLHKLLPLLKNEGHRVLLFSQMTRMLDIVEDFLTFGGFSFCRIDGSTSSTDRLKQITEFNDPKSTTFMFLISTRAGGLGINLPSADTVIIYDPDFNPFVDLQAQARAHRIGQVKTVIVYQLITKCSVEEKILQRSRRKLAMENLVMSSTAKETAEDLNELLLHGARSVLDEHDLEATSVRYSDEDLKQLLSRDVSQSGEDIVETTGYLGAIQTPEDSHSQPPKGTDGSEWDQLLGVTELREVPEELGRGKRSKKAVTYAFEPTLEDEECSLDNESSESSGSEVSLDPEEPPSPCMIGRCKTNVQAFELQPSTVGRTTLDHLAQPQYNHSLGNPLLRGVNIASTSAISAIPPQSSGLELGRALNSVQQCTPPPTQGNAGRMKQINVLNRLTQPVGFGAGDSGVCSLVPAPVTQRQSSSLGSPVNASRPELVEVLSSFRRYVEAMNASCLQTKNTSGGDHLTSLGSLHPSTSSCSSAASITRLELVNRFSSSSTLSMKDDCLAPHVSSKKLEDLKLKSVSTEPVRPATPGQFLPAQSLCGSLSGGASQSPMFPLEAKGVHQAADLDSGWGQSKMAGSSCNTGTPDMDVPSGNSADTLVEHSFSRKVSESAVPVNTAGVCKMRPSIPCSLDSKHTLVAVSEAKQVFGAETQRELSETSDTVGNFNIKSKLARCVKATFRQSSRLSDVPGLKGDLGQSPSPGVLSQINPVNKTNVVHSPSCDLSLPFGCSGALATPLVSVVPVSDTRPGFAPQEKSVSATCGLITATTLSVVGTTPLSATPAVALPSQVEADVCKTSKSQVPCNFVGVDIADDLCDSAPHLQPVLELKTRPPACVQTSDSSLTSRCPYLVPNPASAGNMECDLPCKTTPDSWCPNSSAPRSGRGIGMPKKLTNKIEPRKSLWVPRGDAGMLMFQSPRQLQQNFGVKTRASESVDSPELCRDPDDLSSKQ